MSAGTDKFNVNQSLSTNWEHLQNKHVGTGHPDITKHEWQLQVHRDRLASAVGHHDTSLFYATAQNESIGRIQYKLKEKMLNPCGPPPASKED